MLLTRLALACGCFVAAHAALAQPAASAKPIPVEHFFAQSVIQGPSLSPDGTRVAFLGPVQKRMSVLVFDVATEKLEVVAHDPNEEIDAVVWKSADTLLFASDIGGNESFMWCAVDLKTRKISRLSEASRSELELTSEASLIDLLPNDPDHILVVGTKANAGKNRNAAMDNPDPGIYRLNVRNGSRRMVEKWDGTTSGWLADNAGELRLQNRLRGRNNELEHRQRPTDKWSVLYSHPDTEPEPWRPVRFAADNRTLFVLVEDNAEGGMSLRRYNLGSRTLGDTIFASPDAEIENVIFRRGTDEVLGVVTNKERRTVHWLDAERAKLAEKIQNTLPDHRTTLVSSSRDEKVHLVRAWSDRNPGVYYVLDLRAGKLAVLTATLPDIDPDAMRPMEPMAYTARDGMKIPVYLTRPAGAAGPGPLILLPHGGPYGIRDDWGFDPEVQFLASRGYSVLQVNYRGSGGLGRRHLEAGRGEWGGKMQDDLTDAVKWAIAEKFADPQRVAIYGASYGGYAALAGVTYTPELFRCGVNYIGVADMRLLTRWSSGETKLLRRFYETWISKDPAQLAARSPVNFVERIRVPTLHVYGANDPRVKIEHWTRLEAELKKHGKPYEFIKADDEGHGFRSEENRVGYYKKLEAFLAKHL